MMQPYTILSDLVITFIHLDIRVNHSSRLSALIALRQHELSHTVTQLGCWLSYCILVEIYSFVLSLTTHWEKANVSTSVKELSWHVKAVKQNKTKVKQQQYGVMREFP